jgi:gamma-glutamylcysteine synthetase
MASILGLEKPYSMIKFGLENGGEVNEKNNPLDGISNTCRCMAIYIAVCVGIFHHDASCSK